MDDAASLVSDFVWRRIHALAKSTDESATRATLARLRRGIGKAPGSMPEIWGPTLEGLPEQLLSKSGTPTIGEWAVHTALTLYALHQQGKDLQQKPMSCKNVHLGRAIRRLVKTDEDEERVKRRFDAAATSDNLEEFSHHLRGLVQLLKAEDIPLDYPALTKDLYWFQIPETRDSVRLRWGQDFYRDSKLTDSVQNETGKDDDENGNE
jgi:CRISPR system Cascade subunit CasB